MSVKISPTTQANTSNHGMPPVEVLDSENSQTPSGTLDSSSTGTSAPQGILSETTASGTPQIPQVPLGAQPPLQVQLANTPNPLEALSTTKAGSPNHGSNLPN